MQYTQIDLQSWPRGQMFYYFSKMAPTGYSITLQMDVTEIYRIHKERKIKFFPIYLWLVTKNLCRFTEFKIAEKDGVLGFYDTLTPLYANFHEDDHTFSFMWTEYTDDFSGFYERYVQNQKNYRQTHGVLSQPQTPPPPNAYTVSCIPWVEFSHFAAHSYDNKGYYFPSVEAGKLIKQGNKMLMPLSITCHHASTDGYHVKCFLEALQQDMDAFDKYLK